MPIHFLNIIIKKMARSKFPVRKFGADRRSYKPVAATPYDRRFTEASKINAMNETCDFGGKITATQAIVAGSPHVTVRCDCMHSFSRMTVCKPPFTHDDAIVNFYDDHPVTVPVLAVPVVPVPAVAAPVVAVPVVAVPAVLAALIAPVLEMPAPVAPIDVAAHIVSECFITAVPSVF